MKNIFFMCFMALTLTLNAEEWESYWITAAEDCYQRDYFSAEHHLNMAIHLIESKNDLEHPSIYMDRALLYLLTNRYEEALQDINTALGSANLKDNERLRAISTKIAVRTNLGFSDDYEEDMEFLARNIKIDIEDTEDHIIIRNIPSDIAFKETMTLFFIGTGICQSEDDIKMLSSSICLVNKNPVFENHSENSCSTCPSKQLGRDNRLIEGCKIWCDSSAFAAIRWCSFYPELRLVNACNKAVYEIQNNCRACCQNIYNQDICAAPFSDIVAVMQKYLDTPCGCN